MKMRWFFYDLWHYFISNIILIYRGSISLKKLLANAISLKQELILNQRPITYLRLGPITIKNNVINKHLYYNHEKNILYFVAVASPDDGSVSDWIYKILEQFKNSLRKVL